MEYCNLKLFSVGKQLLKQESELRRSDGVHTKILVKSGCICNPQKYMCDKFLKQCNDGELWITQTQRRRTEKQMKPTSETADGGRPPGSLCSILYSEKEGSLQYSNEWIGMRLMLEALILRHWTFIFGKRRFTTSLSGRE